MSEIEQHGPPEPARPTSRFPELDQLQQEVERRIRDNRRFLEHFLDEDYPDDSDEAPDDGDEEAFEEL